MTDEPDDFADLPVRAIRHAQSGPMAIDYLARDYLARLPPGAKGRGTAAYHDKRFALLAALRDFETAIYIDADSRIVHLPPLEAFPSGLAVLPVVRDNVSDHLHKWGSWRMPVFIELARNLTGGVQILETARWCHESCVSVTKDGRESRFFEGWAFGADFLQARGVYSGEGGVIGLAAAYAGWAVDYNALGKIAAYIRHEGGGPKSK